VKPSLLFATVFGAERMTRNTRSLSKESSSWSPRGFTLLEVTVVLVMAAIIVGLAAPRFLGYFIQRRLQNAAFLVLNDLRLAQQEAVARSAESPRVEICFRTDGYDIYAVRFLDPVNRCELVGEPGCLASSVDIIKVVNGGQEYSGGIAVAPFPATTSCHVSALRAALTFLSSGTPSPNGGYVQLQTGAQTYCVDIETATGRSKIRQKGIFASC